MKPCASYVDQIRPNHCDKCEKRIPKNHPHLYCALCQRLKHYKCEKLTKLEADELAKTYWTCYECLSSILPIRACDEGILDSHNTTKKYKQQCHSCLGWSYSLRNVRECNWCELAVHKKCYRYELGCVKCCVENIPGYSTSSIDLNDDYNSSSIRHTFNPYNKSSLINSIGNQIEELEHDSMYWKDLSEMLTRCEYIQQAHISPSKTNELKVFSLNVRSLHKNITHFREEIHTYLNYDILSLNETNCALSKLPNGINDILLEGFHEPIIQEPARTSGRGGGLVLYVNRQVCTEEQIEQYRPNFSCEEETSGEFQFIKIHNCKGFNKTKLLINVYRSPSRNVDKFMKLLDNVLRSLDRHSRKHILFTGDFNIDLIKYDKDTHSQNLVATFENYGFVQMISRPTRITDHSATLIDHVYSNDIKNTASCQVLTLHISDHLATLTTLLLGDREGPCGRVTSKKPSIKQARKFCEANNAKFQSLIESEDWSEVSLHENCEVQYEKFCEIYTKHYDEAYPLNKSRPRRKNERRDPKPWILPWLEDACARRHELHHLKITTSTKANDEAYEKIDKFCNKHIDLAKAKYYKKFFDEHCENSKKQWQMINTLLNRKLKEKNSIKLKGDDGSIISNGTDVAAKFNNYFSNIASNIKAQISARQTFDPGGFSRYLRNPTANSMYLRPVTPTEVSEVILKFKNKSTLDTKIGPMKVANHNSKFTGVISTIINSSFTQGIFPTALKTARVIPIHKGGSKTDVTNYRPISLLSSFSKIYEKLMHTRVLEFLDKNGSLFESQYGFRPGMSCEHALLNAQNSILHYLGRKQIAVLLLLDYSKAFDLLEHKILLKKLEHYGIRGIALSWFDSYLHDRHQFVTVNGVDSSPKTINYGIPQGSILGPLLFVIYINDLPGISDLAKFILYADDANIIVTGHNEEEIQSKLSLIVTLLVNWVSSNGLSLNLKKTHYMVFSNRRVDYSKISLNISGTNIERVTEARFLGVIIDEKLTWCKHITAVRLKMSRYIGIMFKLKRHLPLKVRLQLYHSFIEAHVNYCSLAWGFAAKCHIETLFRKQKQGMRMVMPGYVNYFYKDGKLPAHTREAFCKFEILTIHGIIVKNALTLMHRMKHFPNTVPVSIRNLFPDNMPTHGSNHENSSEWLDTYNNRCFKASIFFKGPLLALSDTNKNITSLPSLFSINIYKSNAKRVLLEQQTTLPNSEDSWPAFLLHNIPGLRKSNR